MTKENQEGPFGERGGDNESDFAPEFSKVHTFYKKCFEKTEKDEEIEKEVYIIDNFYMYWSGEFIHSIEEDLGNVSNLSHNIFIYYSASKTMEFDWMSRSVKVGHYDLCLRELRNIIEGLVLTYSIESNHKVNKLGEKMSLWEEMEEEYKAHGISVFKSSDLEEWEKYYKIYKDLCKYTHPGVETAGGHAARMALEGNQAREFSYSRKRFLDCYNAWMDVSEVAGSIASKLYSNFRVEPTHFDPNLFSTIRNMNYEPPSESDLEQFIPDESEFE